MNLKKESGLFNLEKREMKDVKGGNWCGCGCIYAGTPGGSSTGQNLEANFDGNLHSPGGVDQVWTGDFTPTYSV